MSRQVTTSSLETIGHIVGFAEPIGTPSILDDAIAWLNRGRDWLVRQAA